MKLKLIASLALLTLAGRTQAQTFTAIGDSIYDYATTTYTTTVTGLSPATIDTSFFGLETVCIDLQHTWNEDLQISIIAPDGTRALLTAQQGGNDYTNTCFNVNAATSIIHGSAPFTGSFAPMGQMGKINNGQNGNGVWTLNITDVYQGNSGRLFSWSLTFGSNPATYIPFVSSNLPIVVINTNYQFIPDEPKIMADMGVIWNGTSRNYMTDPFNHYNGKIGIETRGASTQWAPKKPYNIELWDINGNDIDSSMFGMPAESDWILLANYYDKSLLHNTLLLQLARDMGWYAPRTQHVEVVLNGEYVGVYIFVEKIKRDNNRVDIAKLQPTDISGDELTGGYIFKVDRPGPGWTSNYPGSAGGQISMQYVYPDANDIVPQQETYIQNYVDSFETVLNGPGFANPVTGYARYIDVNSFVDYFILTEICKNIDGYRLSTFLYKKKDSDGGKLVIGPAWDYDLAWGNCAWCEGTFITGWAYNTSLLCPGDQDVPFWWARLLQDTTFANTVKCRWQELRQTVLSQQRLLNYCDSMALYLDESQQRNFRTWPILGAPVFASPWPISPDYAGEINELKLWIQQRGPWLDTNMHGSLVGCTPLAVNATAAPTGSLTVYPNPTNGPATATFTLPVADRVQVTVCDIAGREVVQSVSVQASAGANTVPLNLATLSPGNYFIRINGTHTSLHTQLLINTPQ